MGLGSAVHDRRVLPRYPDRAIGTKTGTDRYRANLSGAVRRPGISRADLDGATVLDTAVGLVDEGHPGSRGMVTGRTPTTGTHAPTGYRDAPEARSR